MSIKNYFKDERTAFQKQADVDYGKTFEQKVIDTFNSIPGITALARPNKGALDDLQNGDIVINSMKGSFRVDVKAGTDIGLHSIRNFKGPFYLSVVGSKYHIIQTKNLKQAISKIEAVQLDKYGQLLPEATNAFNTVLNKTFGSITVIQMTRSKNPGIRINMNSDLVWPMPSFQQWILKK